MHGYKEPQAHPDVVKMVVVVMVVVIVVAAMEAMRKPVDVVLFDVAAFETDSCGFAAVSGVIRFTEEVSTLLRSATSAPSTDTGGCTGATSPMATAVAPVAIDDEEVEDKVVAVDNDDDDDDDDDDEAVMTFFRSPSRFVMLLSQVLPRLSLVRCSSQLRCTFPCLAHEFPCTRQSTVKQDFVIPPLPPPSHSR